MMETMNLVSEGDIVIMEDSHVIEDPKTQRPAILFHVYMILLSLFLTMMVTNWGASSNMSSLVHWENMWI